MNKPLLAAITIGSIVGLGIADILLGFTVRGMLLIGLAAITANLIDWNKK